MASIHSTHATSLHSAHATGLPAGLTLLLASGAGLAVASLYYAQPMLGVLGPDIGASGRAVGLVPTLTQLGYALGILLLAPLWVVLGLMWIVLTIIASMKAYDGQPYRYPITIRLMK